MPKWDHTLDIKEPWKAMEDKTLAYQEGMKKIANLLAKVPIKDEWKSEIVVRFRQLGRRKKLTVRDVDHLMGTLYDWADSRRVWVATF